MYIYIQYVHNIIYMLCVKYSRQALEWGLQIDPFSGERRIIVALANVIRFDQINREFC